MSKTRTQLSSTKPKLPNFSKLKSRKPKNLNHPKLFSRDTLDPFSNKNKLKINVLTILMRTIAYLKLLANGANQVRTCITCFQVNAIHLLLLRYFQRAFSHVLLKKKNGTLTLLTLKKELLKKFKSHNQLRP